MATGRVSGPRLTLGDDRGTLETGALHNKKVPKVPEFLSPAMERLSGLMRFGPGFVQKMFQETTSHIKLPGASERAIESLKRLQREAFSDLMRVRDRLDRLERQFSFYKSNKQGSSFGGSRTQLKGEVNAGGAFLVIQEESSRQSRASLEQARMKTGINAKFTFETFFRERDVLVTECVAGQSSMTEGDVFGGPLTLGKVMYSANINDYFSLLLAPIGAKGKDSAATLNPVQDQSLTDFSGTGPDLFRHCQGSSIGATLKGSNIAVSVAKYLSGWGDQHSGFSDAETAPLCLSTLGQILFQPSEGIKFAVSSLNRFWPYPPVTSSKRLHWSEIGPLVLSKTWPTAHNRSAGSISSSLSRYLSTPAANFNPKGISTQSVALSAEAEFNENMQIGGWLQMERGDWLQESGRKSLQWSVCLSDLREDAFGWGLSIGKSRKDLQDLFIQDVDEDEMYPGAGKLTESQIQVEAFLKIHCGRGFSLQPGLLYVTNRQAHTPVVMLRCSWCL